MKILITGSTGMLGQTLYRDLALRYGTENIVSVSRSLSQTVANHKTIDLTDIRSVERFLKTDHFDLLFYCAAITDLNFCKNHPKEAEALHIVAPKVLSKKIEKVYYISTDSVFDGARGDYIETDTTNPLNYYAKTKQLGEIQVLENAPSPYIIRCNIFGTHLGGGNSLFEWAYRELCNNKCINGFTNVIFNPLYTGMLSNMLLEFENACNAPGIYNFGCRNGLSKFDFLKKIAERFNFDSSLIKPIQLDSSSFQEKRPLNTRLNTDKLEATGIFIPTIEESINQIYQERKLWNEK